MRLKSLREDHNYTQSYIAKYLNFKQNTYSQYENEIRSIPTNALIQLAELYNTSVDYLLEITNEQKPYPKINKLNRF